MPMSKRAADQEAARKRREEEAAREKEARGRYVDACDTVIRDCLESAQEDESRVRFTRNGEPEELLFLMVPEHLTHHIPPHYGDDPLDDADRYYFVQIDFAEASAMLCVDDFTEDENARPVTLTKDQLDTLREVWRRTAICGDVPWATVSDE